MLNNIKKGFTLAEVAIVLVVMSFVACILTPTLISGNEQRVMETSLKKSFEDLVILQDAINLEEIQHTRCSRLDITDSDSMLNTIIGEVTKDDEGKDTDIRDTGGIIPSYLKTMRGQAKADYNAKITTYLNNNQIYAINDTNPTILNTIVFKNGVIWMPRLVGEYQYGTAPNLVTVPTHINIIVDVNGVKSPNKAGRDIFNFQLIKNNDTGKWEVTPLPIGQCGATVDCSCEDYCFTSGPQDNTDAASRRLCAACADKIFNK